MPRTRPGKTRFQIFSVISGTGTHVTLAYCLRHRHKEGALRVAVAAAAVASSAGGCARSARIRSGESALPVPTDHEGVFPSGRAREFALNRSRPEQVGQTDNGLHSFDYHVVVVFFFLCP